MSGNKSKGWFKSAFDFEGKVTTPTVKRSSSTSHRWPASPSSVATLTAPLDTSSSKKPKLSRSTSLTVQQKPTPVARTDAELRQFDWSVDLAPKSVTDLAVHYKKIEEVQQWFRTYDRIKETDPTAILLVSGPAGCGKSTTVKTIASEFQYQVSEWTTPVDVDLFYHDNYDFDGGTKEELTFRENQKDQFDSFLYKTSRYCSIFEGESDNKLLLVKDIPNAFLRDPETLKASLEAYQDTGASPLVFIATDTSSKKLDIVYNLFPPGVLQDFRIHHITFNSVSATLMKKAMKRITSLMVGPEMTQHYRMPSQDMIDSIILSSQGDLRSATLNVHFASLKNAPRLETEPIAGSGVVLNTSGVRSTKGKKKESKLKSVGSDGSITLMHALGRVFNPKFDETNKLHHSPEDLAEAFVSQPGAMISLIHSNYVNRFTDIDDIVGAADVLSLADVITSSSFREDQLTGHGLNLVVRGMMMHNRKTAAGWQQIRKKKTFDKPSVSNHEQQLRKFGLETSSISAGLFVTDYKKYLDIIRKVAKP
ncbi:cell cycle checkpoint protein RAD17-like [Armigeres subalbatus]|uniref:cell cycle checkpoint protein RAD17-like n=1 Tax=Armigeres subalbatus TaxID=124917 RepID=UPI002ED638E5